MKAFPWKTDAFVGWGCHKITLDGAAKTTDIHPPAVLEAETPKCGQGWFLPRPLSWACGRPSPPYVFTWSFLCPCDLTSCPYKDPSPVGSGPTPVTSSYLGGSISTYSYMRDMGFQLVNFEGIMFSLKYETSALHTALNAAVKSVQRLEGP